MAEKGKGIWVEDWMADVTDHERLFALLFNLCVLNKSAQVELGVSYLSERLHKSERTIQRWTADMVDEGCIQVDIKRGRSARNTYILNTTTLSPFLDEKTRQLLQKNTTSNTTTVSPFSGLPHTPSMDKKNINNKNNDKNISSFDASSKAEEDGQEKEEKIILFREDEQAARVDPEITKSFAEFWKLFAPIDKEKCKYKKALLQWQAMSEIWRGACIKYLERTGKPTEQNPFFFLQHFAPVFLDDRQQYNAWKQHVQLCRVRYENKQPICSAWMAEIFQLTILDEHYEKIFDK